MSPETAARVALALQWGAFLLFVALVVGAAVAGGRYPRVRYPRVRPTAFAVGVLSLAHATYYAFFLIWPDVFGAYGTMLSSIGTRWIVAFVAAAVLIMAVLGDRWKGL